MLHFCQMAIVVAVLALRGLVHAKGGACSLTLDSRGCPPADFCRLSAELAFGKDSAALREGRLLTVQGLSGTGSLRVRRAAQD